MRQAGASATAVLLYDTYLRREANQRNGADPSAFCKKAGDFSHGAKLSDYTDLHRNSRKRVDEPDCEKIALARQCFHSSNSFDIMRISTISGVLGGSSILLWPATMSVNQIQQPADLKDLPGSAMPSQEFYYSPLRYVQAMMSIAWSAFAHPFSATVIDLATGDMHHEVGEGEQ